MISPCFFRYRNALTNGTEDRYNGEHIGLQELTGGRKEKLQEEAKNQECTIMDKVEKKRKKEQYVVEEMIRLYCRKNHTNEKRKKGSLCPACQELSDYAKLRSEKCPFMEEKTFCANCKVHCYKPEKREQIRQVMRFSGPRMLLYHPILAIWHLICSKREKIKGENL